MGETAATEISEQAHLHLVAASWVAVVESSVVPAVRLLRLSLMYLLWLRLLRLLLLLRCGCGRGYGLGFIG